MNSYYSIPQLFTDILKGETARKVDLEDSVKQHINLLVLSRLSSYRYDESFGAAIWEKDFEAVIFTNTYEWCQEVANQLYEAITTFEKRVIVERGEVEVTPYNYEEDTQRRAERCIKIIVNGKLNTFSRPTFEEITFLMNVSPLVKLD